MHFRIQRNGGSLVAMFEFCVGRVKSLVRRYAVFHSLSMKIPEFLFKLQNCCLPHSFHAFIRYQSIIRSCIAYPSLNHFWVYLDLIFSLLLPSPLRPFVSGRVISCHCIAAVIMVAADFSKRGTIPTKLHCVTCKKAVCTFTVVCYC